MRIDLDLLDIAEQLARLDPNRPRQAALRRAISTAYYAVFHAVAISATNALVDWKKPWEIYSPIYRSLDHAKAKRILQGWSKSTNSDFAIIGRNFVELQEKRHAADYDPEPNYGRGETVDLINQARITVGLLNRLSPDDRLRLSVQLIGRSR